LVRRNRLRHHGTPGIIPELTFPKPGRPATPKTPPNPPQSNQTLWQIDDGNDHFQQQIKKPIYLATNFSTAKIVNNVSSHHPGAPPIAKINIVMV
jgi:hypothetical protein